MLHIRHMDVIIFNQARVLMIRDLLNGLASGELK
jgi:hypothetical protein